MNIISLSRILAYWAEKQPHGIAVKHNQEYCTWLDIDKTTNRLARAYAALGVKENDLVTVGLPNSIEFFEACFAIWKLGATPQPVSAKLPVFERKQIMEVANPSLVLGASPEEHPGFNVLEQGFLPDLLFGDDPLPEVIGLSLIHISEPTRPY